MIAVDVAVETLPASGTTRARSPRRPSPSNDEFLERALKLFLERGFERTSLDAISAYGGVAKRTIYLRYADKTSLFKAALKRAIENWIVPVTRLHAAETDNLEETLLAIGRMLLDNVMSPAGLSLLRLTNAVSERMPGIGAFNVKQGTEPTIAYLADLFCRRMADRPGGLPDPESAAAAFLNLVVSGPANSAAWGLQLDKESIDRHTRFSVHFFLHGLLHHGQASQAPDDAVTLDDERSLLNDILDETMHALTKARDRLGSGRADRSSEG